MSAKHTPGPWMLGELSDDVINPNGVAIASQPSWQAGPQESAAARFTAELERWHANARLIVAAPVLLRAAERAERALQLVLTLNEDPSSRVRGYGNTDWHPHDALEKGDDLIDPKAAAQVRGAIRSLSAAIAKARGES